MVKKLRIIDVNARVLELAAVESKKEFFKNMHQWVNPYFFEKYKAYILELLLEENILGMGRRADGSQGKRNPCPL